MQNGLILLGCSLVALLFIVWSGFRRLRDSEAYFRSLFENALELITVLDARGRVVYENPSNERFVGYGRKEMVGRNIFELIHPDDLPAVQAIFAGALKKPGAAPPIVFRLKHKDGSWRWLESYGNNLLGDKAVRGLVINSRDVTEKIRDEARIKELNELRNRFIQVVSHQLRTPLSGIRWTLEALTGGAYGEVNKEQAEPLKTSLDANVEIIRRINDMLTAIDVEEGRVTLRKSRASLEDVWQKVLLEWKGRCTQKGLRCDYFAPDQRLPTADFDSDKIADALAKLTDNALRYTAPGGKAEARIRVVGGRVRFEIQDTGIGIPKKEQERIFTRFFRASNATNMLPDANGISLSIARHFVEAHGGSVGFASEEDKGSTFWIELPV